MLAEAGLGCPCFNRSGLPAIGINGSIGQCFAVAVPDDYVKSIPQVRAQQVLEEEKNFLRCSAHIVRAIRIIVPAPLQVLLKCSPGLAT